MTRNDASAKQLGIESIDGQNLPKNLICFSHLRWDFVFQRPQHLLTRLAQTFDILFIEEPIYDGTDDDYYTFSIREGNVRVAVPHIRPQLSHAEHIAAQKQLLENYLKNKNPQDYAFWYYTPMALEFSRNLLPEIVIYDCMDELSAFKFAPVELKNLEKELLKHADLVFTGGYSLYEAKKDQHQNIHPFPSSIEKEHFLKSPTKSYKSNTQFVPASFTLGFYGVIDERFDIELIRGIADARPEWQIELIGPVVKIDPETLPKNQNINYLGGKSYQELPQLIATWDIALIPFLLNESTRFISPTKTPEYLAAGLPVISTPIRDVIDPYGNEELVYIGANASDFIAAAELEMASAGSRAEWLDLVDTFLDQISWDITIQKMLVLLHKVNNKNYSLLAKPKYV